MSIITFKKFLLEGGKATEKHGTVRATSEDIKLALRFVSKHTGIDIDVLADHLLGSGRLTYKNLQKDSGDIDIAIEDTGSNKDELIQKLKDSTKAEPYVIGGSTYSFPVPTKANRKVQVDIMFVPDVRWAKFSHFSSQYSKHKSGVRNELIHSALKFSPKEGEDIRIKDENGNDIIRASRSYKLDKGVERIFKIAPTRKDGKGRVKGTQKATPEQVQAELKKEGRTEKFSSDSDIINDPDQFAKHLFGNKVKAKDMLSTEQMIRLIKKYKPDQAKDIFKDAVKGMGKLKFTVPQELQQYL